MQQYLKNESTICAKNETQSNVYSCKSIAMTLAIKRVHNLPSHLSFVSTLPDITQKLKRDIDELKH